MPLHLDSCITVKWNVRPDDWKMPWTNIISHHWQLFGNLWHIISHSIWMGISNFSYGIMCAPKSIIRNQFIFPFAYSIVQLQTINNVCPFPFCWCRNHVMSHHTNVLLQNASSYGQSYNRMHHCMPSVTSCDVCTQTHTHYGHSDIKWVNRKSSVHLGNWKQKLSISWFIANAMKRKGEAPDSIDFFFLYYCCCCVFSSSALCQYLYII